MDRDIAKHIPEEQLEAYAMNSLSRNEVETVEEHLLFCTACQDQLQSVEHYVKAMRGAANRLTKEQAAALPSHGAWDWLRTRLPASFPIWASAAALACLILAVGVQLRHTPGPGQPVEVELQAVRGVSSVPAKAGHTLHLHLDHRGVNEMPSWQIEIVGEDGRRVWSGTGTWSTKTIDGMVNKALGPGTYFVRLLKEGAEPTREYELVLQ